jgi:hypothetical protein
VRVGRAALAMRTFAAVGVDVLLAGHLHRAHAERSAERVELGDYSALLVQAGTATSTRGRGEANSFNVIELARRAIAIERYAWEPRSGAFGLAERVRFARAGRGWIEADRGAGALG